MWDGEVVKFETPIKKKNKVKKLANNTKLDFCVMATPGNHILEVYGASKYSDESTRWSFSVNQSEW